MADISEQIKALLYANVDGPGLLNDLLDTILEPALDKIVKDSANQIDDVVKAALYPLLEAELKKLAKDGWDKLLKPAPQP